MVVEDPVFDHIDLNERLCLMRLDQRAPRVDKLPLILRYAASFPLTASHWDRVSMIRTSGQKKKKAG